MGDAVAANAYSGDPSSAATLANAASGVPARTLMAGLDGAADFFDGPTLEIVSSLAALFFAASVPVGKESTGIIANLVYLAAKSPELDLLTALAAEAASPRPTIKGQRKFETDVRKLAAMMLMPMLDTDVISKTASANINPAIAVLWLHHA